MDSGLAMLGVTVLSLQGKDSGTLDNLGDCFGVCFGEPLWGGILGIRLLEAMGIRLSEGMGIRLSPFLLFEGEGEPGIFEGDPCDLEGDT